VEHHQRLITAPKPTATTKIMSHDHAYNRLTAAGSDHTGPHRHPFNTSHLGDATDAESLAAGGLRCLLGLARESNGALTWTGTPGGDEIDPTLYSGSAGIVITLLEAYQHFGDDRYADAAIRGARGIAAEIDSVSHCSLYFGLTGMAVALRAVDDVLGDSAAGVAADRAL